MVSLSSLTYWCYASAALVQGAEAVGLVLFPARMVALASDAYAQFFLRVTGVCLLPLTQFFWRFRHAPFHGADATVASYSAGCARLFAKFHALLALLLGHAMFHLRVSLPHGQCLLGAHLAWAMIMTYALVQHHYNVHGFIIDTTSAPAAAKSFKHLVQGDDDEPRTVLQMIKGEDSGSKSVMQMFREEIKTD